MRLVFENGRGHIEPEGGDDERVDVSEWPNCVVADCPFKSCLRLNSEYCWAHHHGLPLTADVTVLAPDE